MKYGAPNLSEEIRESRVPGDASVNGVGSAVEGCGKVFCCGMYPKRVLRGNRQTPEW